MNIHLAIPSAASSGPARQKKRQAISGAPRACSTTCPTPESGRKLQKTPSPISAASRSIRSRSAAITIGISCCGAVSSLNPPTPRSPRRTGRSVWTVSRTFESGLTNGTSFQRSTIAGDEEPIPSTKRPDDASASAAADCASSDGPRVYGFTTPVIRRVRSVQAAASASGVKPSAPLVSALQRSS